MRSQARIEAGRRNGMLAKGKKSEEARQKCAENSVKHGLFSKTLVLANESRELLEETRKTYYEVWKPENEFGAGLVNDMIAARWRLNRIMMVECEIIDLRQARMDHSGELKKEFEIIPEPTRLAIAYDEESNKSQTLANLSRYGARYFRQFRQAAAELSRIQKDRRAAERDEAAEEAITCEPEPICKNEGSATPKPTPKPLEIVRTEPKATHQSQNSPEEGPKSDA